MNKIITYLSEQKQLFMPLMEDFAKKFEKKYGHLTQEYQDLATLLREYLLRGGKWHRPALSMLTYQMFGGKQPEKVRKAALSTEIMHRFLLVHDDIIDQDMMRHGGPTIEKIYHDRFKKHYPEKKDEIYSKANAIVAGDVLSILGSEIILQSEVDDEIKLALLSAINQMILETAAGWQLQNEQNYKTIEEVTFDDFFKGMQLVSCQYSIVWPLRIGEILAGKLNYKHWDKGVEDYGWNCGAAFQIVDDILGMFGEEKDTGKPAGHDYREGKKTFLVLKAYENATEADRWFLSQTLGTDVSETELNRVRDIMIKTGSLDFSKRLAEDHTKKAIEALKNVRSQSVEAIELLVDFASFLSERTH